MTGASLLVVLAAGCQHGTDTTSPQPTVPTAAVTWQGFTDGCPTLTAPPYGIDAHGKGYPDYIAPGEQDVLDKVIPGASFDQTYCSFKTAGADLPVLGADVRIFRGANGASQVDTLFQVEKSAAKKIAGVDYADAPQLGDDAFAWYFQSQLHMTARSGNAYIVIQVLLDKQVTKTFDVLQPLPPQVPALSKVMTDLLAELH